MMRLHKQFLPVMTFVVLGAGMTPAFGQQSSLRTAQTARGFKELLASMGGDTTGKHPIKCGLPVIGYAMQHRERMSYQLQASLHLASERPQLQKSLVAGRFRVHYDTTGFNTAAFLDNALNPIPGTADAYADSVASIANHVYDFEVGTLGYLPPPPDTQGGLPDSSVGGGPEFDLYVANLGFGLYGLTVPETPLDSLPDGRRYTTFMMLHNTFDFVQPSANAGLPGLRVTVAHEFHHSIQLGNYGYWTQEQYYYEITSTWMEDVVYPEVKDYYQYVKSTYGQLSRPQVQFTWSNAGDNIMYSRAIWGHYVAKKFGRDAMKLSWEYIGGIPSPRREHTLAAIDSALHRYNSTLAIAFGEWTFWNYHTGIRSDPAYYPSGRDYPLMTTSPVGLDSDYRVVDDSLQSLASRYIEVVLRGTSVATLMTANVNVSSAAAEDASYYPYAYSLATSRRDDRYLPVKAGLFVWFDAPDGSNWWTSVSGVRVTEGVPYPNPFIADGTPSSYVSIPVLSQRPVTGVLYLFNTSMDLVYKAEKTSQPFSGDRQIVMWDGRTNSGAPARSGIYMCVFSLPDRNITAKIALIRR